MEANTIENEYFDWLCDVACDGDRFRIMSYYNLFYALHERDFWWSINNDENRSEDGISLRSRFASVKGYDQNRIFISLSWPCSVFEMMIALALHCEEDIMDDPQIGNRTTQWFWGMIRSLGLMGMRDQYFDQEGVDNILDVFLDRQYTPIGEGGLFTIKKCTSDLRDVEIWHQLCWYLDNLEGY